MGSDLKGMVGEELLFSIAPAPDPSLDDSGTQLAHSYRFEVCRLIKEGGKVVGVSEDRCTNAYRVRVSDNEAAPLLFQLHKVAPNLISVGEQTRKLLPDDVAGKTPEELAAASPLVHVPESVPLAGYQQATGAAALPGLDGYSGAVVGGVTGGVLYPQAQGISAMNNARAALDHRWRMIVDQENNTSTTQSSATEISQAAGSTLIASPAVREVLRLDPITGKWVEAKSAQYIANMKKIKAGIMVKDPITGKMVSSTSAGFLRNLKAAQGVLIKDPITNVLRFSASPRYKKLIAGLSKGARRAHLRELAKAKEAARLASARATTSVTTTAVRTTTSVAPGTGPVAQNVARQAGGLARHARNPMSLKASAVVGDVGRVVNGKVVTAKTGEYLWQGGKWVKVAKLPASVTTAGAGKAAVTATKAAAMPLRNVAVPAAKVAVRSGGVGTKIAIIAAAVVAVVGAFGVHKHVAKTNDPSFGETNPAGSLAGGPSNDPAVTYSGDGLVLMENWKPISAAELARHGVTSSVESYIHDLAVDIGSLLLDVTIDDERPLEIIEYCIPGVTADAGPICKPLGPKHNIAVPPHPRPALDAMDEAMHESLSQVNVNYIYSEAALQKLVKPGASNACSFARNLSRRSGDRELYVWEGYVNCALYGGGKACETKYGCKVTPKDPISCRDLSSKLIGTKQYLGYNEHGETEVQRWCTSYTRL